MLEKGHEARVTLAMAIRVRVKRTKLVQSLLLRQQRENTSVPRQL